MDKLLLLILIGAVIVAGVGAYIYVNYSYNTNIVTPLQQKAQDQNNLNQVSDIVQELNNKILTTATGNVETPIKGTWNIDAYNNFISFTTSSKTTKIAPDAGWVQVSDNMSTIVAARSDSTKDGYTIEYRINFNSPLIVSSGDKPSSTSVKSIAITKNSNNIVLTLLE